PVSRPCEQKTSRTADSLSRKHPRLLTSHPWDEPMNLEKELRSAWRIVVSICRFAWWCAVTTWLGASALWQLARRLSRWPDIASQTMHCPRGHKVPTHGVFECRCGALHEGWVFGHC